MCLAWVASKEFVMGGPHAERERFSSLEILSLGWVNEGVHLMLNLRILWAREFIVGKTGMRVRVRARSSDDGRESPWSRTTSRIGLLVGPRARRVMEAHEVLRLRVHAWTHSGYECGKVGVLWNNKYLWFFGWVYFIFFLYLCA